MRSTTRVVVPVRYPLSERSERTLASAVEIAADRGAELTVPHVDIYQAGRPVTRGDLRRAVERTFGRVPRPRDAVRNGFPVEETVLEEVAEGDADVVVAGSSQSGSPA
jgi:nucleotide-binding universal stress UspA family protein